MSGVDDGELHALRIRAYGPHADIQGDPIAMGRLRELEEASRPQVERVPDRALAPERPALLPEVAQLAQPTLDDDELDSPAREWMRRLGPQIGRGVVIGARRVRRLRRSTVLIALCSALVVTVVLAALVLVQRVQPDPLGAGAEQVARLSIDPTYEVPAVFAGGGESEIVGIQEFYGLRAIVGSRMWSPESGDICFNLFSSSDITDPDSQSYSGSMMSGCAAGDFPAMIQFRPDIEGFPDELSTAFQGSTGLQFVYDSKNQEIVVFATK